MSTADSMLDADELLHLALAATKRQHPENALKLLKEGLKLAPSDGRLHYLLGAVHAGLGMYDRAISEIGKAMELLPALTTARFQLGLLHLTSGNAKAAEEAWAPLDTLDKQDPLYLFKTGLLHLVRDDFRSCVELLRSGIERNAVHEELNTDMRRVIAEAEKALSQRSPGVVRPAGEPAHTPGKRALLSAYRGDNGDLEH